MHSLNSQIMFLSEKNKKYILSYDKKNSCVQLIKFWIFANIRTKKFLKLPVL